MLRCDNIEWSLSHSTGCDTFSPWLSNPCHCHSFWSRNYLTVTHYVSYKSSYWTNSAPLILTLVSGHSPHWWSVLHLERIRPVTWRDIDHQLQGLSLARLCPLIGWTHSRWGSVTLARDLTFPVSMVGISKLIQSRGWVKSGFLFLFYKKRTHLERYMSILRAYFYHIIKENKTSPCLMIVNNDFLILNFSHYFQVSLNIF